MENLDYSKVHDFWEGRCKRNKICGDLYVANLSDNIPLQAMYKDNMEKKEIAEKVVLNKDKCVLDLGCGSGRMLPFFAIRTKRVVGVDFSESLLKFAKKVANEFNLANISLIQQHIAEFCVNDKFDIIFAGGVFSSLNDTDLERAIKNIKNMLTNDGSLIVRDSLSWRKRCVLKEKFIYNFQERYSVIYRTIEEIKQIMAKYDFLCVYEKSLSVFPFMGVYHYIFRKLLGRGSLYDWLSKFYFKLTIFLSPYIYWYKNTMFYICSAYWLNKYEQKLFIFRQKN